MLNIAGPEYDFGSVVFVVLQECEHRRRGLEDDQLDWGLTEVARKKLAEIKAAYDEFGGSAVYWKDLEHEVLETEMPQYIHAAREMNRLERNAFNVWRGGDPLARFFFALAGLVIGSIIIELPFIPIFEVMFAFALAGAGFVYPDIKRFTHEHRHARALNRLIAEAAAYQSNARLHYMTSKEIHDSFTLGAGPTDETTTTTTEVERMKDE